MIRVTANDSDGVRRATPGACECDVRTRGPQSKRRATDTAADTARIALETPA